MSVSILTSTKKVLGIAENYEVFDVDITMHINSVFSALNQLGVGPTEGYMIEDATSTWDDFFSGANNSLQLNNVKTYMYLQVRLWFDPPQTHYLITAHQAQIAEIVYRISTAREGTEWVAPPPPPQDPVTDPSDLWDWLA